MKVTIIRDGVYSDFQPGGKCGAVERRQGDKVNYPRWYAESLIESGLARESVEIVEMTAPEVIPFSEPVLSPTVEWEDEPTPSYDPFTAVEWQDEESAKALSDEPDATHRARELATAHGLKLGSIEGTGKDGRITAADVRGAIKGASDE